MEGLNMRTTSSVESLNAQLARTFPRRSNIFDFCTSLKLFEFGKSENMRHLKKSLPKGQLERKRKGDRKRDDAINKHTQALKSNKVTLEQFIDAVADDPVLSKGTTFLLCSYKGFFLLNRHNFEF